MVLHLRGLPDGEELQGEGLLDPRLLSGEGPVRYVCTFEDDGGNQVSLLSSDVDSESAAILEVGERLKEKDSSRTWRPLNCEEVS